MEALAQSKKWRGVAIVMLIATFGVVLGLKPPMHLRGIIEPLGLLIAIAAMCVAHLFDHISEFGRHRSIAQVFSVPVICLVILMQTADRMAKAMNVPDMPLQGAMLGGFALGVIVLVYATCSLQKFIPRQQGVAATNSK